MKAASGANHRLLARIAVSAVIVIAVLLAAFAVILHFALTSSGAEARPDIDAPGYRWVSEDGGITISNYAKTLVQPADSGKPTVLDIEYFGMGSMSNDDGRAEVLCQYFRSNNGTCYITLIESEHPLDMSAGRVQTAYTGKKLAELMLETFDKNAFTAVVCYADPSRSSLAEGDKIHFTQASDVSAVSADGFRLYFNGDELDGTDINYADMSSVHSVEIMLYTKDEFCSEYGFDKDSLALDS